MTEGGTSAVFRSNSDTLWQPLKRIVSRQTIQRMDVCRRQEDALTEIGEKKLRRAIENWGTDCGSNPGLSLVREQQTHKESHTENLHSALDINERPKV